MNTPVKFTLEAFQDVTDKQREKIAWLVRPEGNVVDLIVFKDFTLPEGYVGVIIEYKDGHSIYGGIDPKGEMST